MAKVGDLWVVRGRRLEGLRWKSKGKPPGKGLECQHEELDCGWRAVGSHGTFLRRREAGPIGGRWLGMGQPMEGKLVLPGACAPDFLSFCLKQETRRGPRSPLPAFQSWLGLTIPSPGIWALF